MGRNTTTVAAGVAIVMGAALAACGQQSAEPGDAGPTTAAGTAPAATAEVTGEPAATGTAGTSPSSTSPVTQATETATTGAAPTSAGPTAESTGESSGEEPTTEEPAAGSFPEGRAEYVEALLEAWRTGDTEAGEALATDEVAAVGRCLAEAGKAWQRSDEDYTADHNLGWAGYPGLVSATATGVDGEHGEVWLYLEDAKLGGPDAVVGVNVNWPRGDLEVTDDCFGRPAHAALAAWADGDAEPFTALLADEIKPEAEEYREWLRLDSGELELTGLWAFSAYEDLRAQLVVVLRPEGDTVDDHSPLLELDPAPVLQGSHDGAVTRVTLQTEGVWF